MFRYICQAKKMNREKDLIKNFIEFDKRSLFRDSLGIECKFSFRKPRKTESIWQTPAPTSNLLAWTGVGFDMWLSLGKYISSFNDILTYQPREFMLI